MKFEKKEKSSTKTNARELTYESVRKEIRGNGPYQSVVNAERRRLKAARRLEEYVPSNEECKETDLQWIAERRDEENKERQADKEEYRSSRYYLERKWTSEELTAAEVAEAADELKWRADEPKRRRKEDRELRREQRQERMEDRKFEKTGIPPPSP